MKQRLNLKLKPEINEKLRKIAELTGLKLVTIISLGIQKIWEEKYGK